MLFIINQLISSIDSKIFSNELKYSLTSPSILILSESESLKTTLPFESTLYPEIKYPCKLLGMSSLIDLSPISSLIKYTDRF
jgi:hypothetical protein